MSPEPFKIFRKSLKCFKTRSSLYKIQHVKYLVVLKKNKVLLYKRMVREQMDSSALI